MRNWIISSTLIVALLCLLGGCSSKKEKKDVAGEALNPKVVEFLRSGLEFKLGDRIADIKQNLGPPSSEKTERLKSEALGGAGEEMHRLDYPGLSVEVDRLGGSEPRENLIRLTITDGKYKTKMGLTIGTPQREVKRILGEPWGVVAGTFVYEEDIGALTFYFQGDVVRKIQWEWYTE